MKKIYFDNAATTPLHPKVLEKMVQFLKEDFGNPSSIHSFGRKVRVAIEKVRETVAEFINAKPSEIYFTSGGTEANNFVVFGIANANYIETGLKEIITTKAEHHSVLDSLLQLEKLGFSVKFLDVNKTIKVDLQTVQQLVTNETSLVSIIHINNETGSINDIKTLASTIKKNNLYFHTDAVQSFGKVKIDVNELLIDALTASAHKINGPKGIGFAYVRSGTPISPLIYGGSQERNRRGGTENVAGIIGLGEAINILKNSNAHQNSNYEYVSKLRTRFIEGLRTIDKNGLIINGDENNFPYILSVTFSSEFYNNDSEAMLMYLDINGIAASNGSACTSGTLKPSHVILSSGKSLEDANGTIRFSFGLENTLDEVDYALEIVKKMTEKFKK
ncbi:cysteine desulfurase family protein [Melioribacteraceae bacterium 4301-Me]|uniref:cysteine desulfurase family protein n=1 Tax=Pyranulibacter aquaticus TaxID=3163344 RepID=UPI003598EC45